MVPSVEARSHINLPDFSVYAAVILISFVIELYIVNNSLERRCDMLIMPVVVITAQYIERIRPGSGLGRFDLFVERRDECFSNEFNVENILEL